MTLMNLVTAKDWDKGPVSLEKIDNLIFDWSVYPRKEVDHNIVRSYARALKAGSVFPPVKAGLLSGKKIIVDGLHRIHSRKLLGIPYVDCIILPFESEAELFAEAVRLNSDHGKAFSEVEVKANIRRLRRYEFSVKDIVALTHVPAGEIHREIVAGPVTAPSGRKIHCNLKNVDCNGQPDTRELLQFKNALILIRDVAHKGCIPTDDEFFKNLVLQCRSALRKVRFNV